MKIALVTENFHPQSYADAIRMKPIVDELEKEFNSITIYTSKDSGRPESSNIVENIIKRPGKSSNLVRLINELFCSIELFFKLLFSKKYDLYVVTSPPYFVTIASVMAIQIKRGKYVLDIRDLYPEMFFNFNLLQRSSIIGKVLTYLSKRSYKKSILVTTVTKGLQKEIEGYSSDINVELIRNGFDANIFVPSKSKYPKFTISFHGSIARYTDVQLILSLAEVIEEKNLDIDIQIIGSGIKDESFKNCKYSCIKYYGRLNNEKTAKKVSKSHLGISFRTNEFISKTSFPVKVYEYIGLAIPMIITPISEAGDFVVENDIGYQFDNYDVDDLIARIITIYEDPSILDDLTNNIYKIREDYTRQASSVKFVKSLKDSL